MDCSGLGLGAGFVHGFPALWVKSYNPANIRVRVGTAYCNLVGCIAGLFAHAGARSWSDDLSGGNLYYKI